MCGNDFAIDAHLDLGQTERLADLADRRARAVGVDHRDAARPLVAVTGQDHVVDVLAPGGLDVDVDVGQVLAHRVHEPFERQVVTQRVDVGDAGEVAHERAGGAAPARGRGCPSSSCRRRCRPRSGSRPRTPSAGSSRARDAAGRGGASSSCMPRSWTPRQHAFGQQRIGAAAFRRREVGEVAPAPAPGRTRSSRRSRASCRPGRAVRRTARASPRDGFSQPSALRRVTLVSATGTMRRMHSSASATNASPGSR